VSHPPKPHPFFDVPRPISIGHRGCAGEAPENTQVSFERALAAGAAVLESDVHLTRDGVPVLIHDPEIDRVSNGTGPVAEWDWNDLRQLDAGCRFGSDGEFAARGISIPSLEDAFAAFPGARFNLELKAPNPRLVELVVELVARENREDRTLLTAEKDDIMVHLRERLDALEGPAIAQGASVADVLGFVNSALEGGPPPQGPMALQIPAEFAGGPLVTRELVEHAHAHGVQVHVWTINDPEQMRALLELGCDGIVSDFPARLPALLAAESHHD
jgi:glycerophosphoryl diester phosphodiesterase